MAKIALMLLLIAMFGMSGCRGFVRPGATNSDFYQDLRACEAENTIVPVAPQISMSMCSGYACSTSGSAQGGVNRRRRNQCMMARGWELSRSFSAYRP